MFNTGRSKINKHHHGKCIRVLDVLDAAVVVWDMNLPGYDFHDLKNFKPTRYSVHINGNYCITFEFEKGDAFNVHYEDYH